MRKLWNIPALRYGMIMLAAFVGLILLCIGEFQWINIRDKNYVLDIARRLGATDEAIIATATPCTEIIPQCWVYVFYKTDMSFEEMEQAIHRLGWRKDPLLQGDPGSSLFTRINGYTSKRLLLNGVDPFYLRPSQFKEPGARKWTIWDENNKEIMITLYTLHDNDIYELDGERITSNIVVIRMRR